MKIVMTLLVRDEEDILESHLRFHLSRGVDFILVTDNLSEDSTPNILERFAREGRVRVIREADDTYSQAVWVTRMARMAHEEHGADWVINSDADEFWWPKQGDIRHTLSSIPTQSGLLEVPRVNFLPRPEDGRRFYERMILRDVVSQNTCAEPLPPKVCHRGCPDVVVAQGNHEAEGTGLDAFEKRQPLIILHFPMRSYPQFERKIRLGGRAYMNNTELPEGIGKTWRELYQTYLAGELPTFYADQLPGQDAIEQGIQTGRWIRDQRLHRFFQGQPQ